jgi:hypothetical protein
LIEKFGVQDPPNRPKIFTILRPTAKSNLGILTPKGPLFQRLQVAFELAGKIVTVYLNVPSLLSSGGLAPILDMAGTFSRAFGEGARIGRTAMKGALPI